jgi:peptidoglycan/LPS O-acetylase OafA/YrhL
MIKQFAVLKPGAMRVVLAVIVIAMHYAMFVGAPFVTRVDGVPVYGFFFLSGYWVSKLWDAKYVTCRNPIGTFYISRAWRIYPLGTLGTALMIGALYLTGNGSTVAAANVPISLLLGLPGYEINPPAWSLAIEVQFYLVAPFLLPLIKRPGWAAVAAIVTSAGWLLFALSIDSGPRSTLLHFGLPLVLGAIWANWRLDALAARLAPYSFGVLAFFGVVVNVAGFYLGLTEVEGFVRSQEMIVALLFFPAVAASLSVMSDEADRLLSDYAYPLYLFHFPAWLFVSWLLPNPFIALLPALALTAALSQLAILYIDRPLERRRREWVRGCATIEKRDAIPIAAVPDHY